MGRIGLEIVGCTVTYCSFSQMPFVKKIKSGAYFSRFQVKYRRRREGKTDCELHGMLFWNWF